MRRLCSVVATASALLLAACTTAASSTPAGTGAASGTSSPVTPATTHGSPSPAPGGSDRPRSGFTPWWTYHRTTSRSGLARRAAGTPLRRAWSKHLGDAVYGEPLVVGSTLVVATEGNRVLGLDARTGAVRWRTHLGKPQPPTPLPCGDIDPLGITGTPAYDRATGSVFLVAETPGGNHTLWALNARNGHERWHRSLDVLPHRNRSAEQQRPAVLVAHGRVLVSFGALAGDCDNYVGYVTSTSTSGTGAVHHYAVPTERGGGMWSPAGPVLGRNGHVYLVSANGAAAGPGWDRSNSVLELTAKRLHLVSAFAPTTWRQDSLDDLGLGSTSPVAIPSLHRLVVGSKRSRIYLLREHFGGIGSGVTTIDGCSTFGGPAVRGHVVIEPCLYEDQMRALHVGSHRLRWGWTRKGIYGSPIIAGPRVYVADRGSGDLVVLRVDTGRILQRIHAGDLTHFPSVTVDGGFVFVPTLSGVTAFHG